MELIHIRQTPSTNLYAREAVESGRITGPALIVADKQTAGRGTRGRYWIGLNGNLFATYCLALPRHEKTPHLYVYPIALAIADTVAFLTDRLVTLKWPNDVLVDGAKVSGCLLELAEGPQSRFLLAGIGVNLAAHPEGLGYPATDLSNTGPHDPVDVAQALGKRITHWFDIYAQQAFEAIRSVYWSRRAFAGKPVRIETRDKRTYQGVAEDLANDGALLLRTESGLVRLYAGDIFPLGEAGRRS